MTEINSDKPYEKTIPEVDTIVISGGSTKGLIALGSLQYLYDNFMCKNVVNFVGTSSGSMVGYLLAIGYTPIEIIVYICTNHCIERMQSFDLVSMINGNGAISFDVIYQELEKMTMQKINRVLTLGELYKSFGKKLICATYNNTLKKTEYLGPDNYPEMPCLIAIRMSSNIPLLFEPFRYMNCYYIDGAITDNFPIEKAEEIGEKIIGIIISGSDPPEHPGDKMIEYLFGIMSIFSRKLSEIKIENCKNKDITIVRISTEIGKSTFDFQLNSKDKLDMFSCGYGKMREIIEKKINENVKKIEDELLKQ